MSYETPMEVEAACLDHDWHTGETKRIRHAVREDGSDCSPGKTAALSILRKANGWWWRCFRCGMQGFKPDRAIPVEQVETEMAALRYIRPYKALDHVSLPVDMILLADDPSKTKEVPNYAYSWLFNNNLDGSIYKNYNVGWSPRFQRVIIPIYEYHESEVKGVERKLVGWVGRDARNLSKDMRARLQTPKYILRKKKDYNRIYFTAPAPSDTYIFVEDALSAMKIRDAVSVNTIALLTTHIPTSMLMKFVGKKIILWLDQDQLFNMILTQAKATHLGLDVKYIHTNKDPKGYNTFAIQHKINGRR